MSRPRGPISDETKATIKDMARAGYSFTRIMRACKMGEERLRQFLHENDIVVKPARENGNGRQLGMPPPITTRRKGRDDPLLDRLRELHAHRMS